jgi:hypothetical protein
MEFVTYALEQAGPLLKNIAKEQSILWTESLMQVDARLALTEACMAAPKVDTSTCQAAASR